LANHANPARNWLGWLRNGSDAPPNITAIEIAFEQHASNFPTACISERKPNFAVGDTIALRD
jgi:hypothetical protein